MGILPFTLLGFGFLSGIRHAFEADHIAAVSTMAGSPAKNQSLIGAFWGIGHLAALFAAGLIVLLFRISIPQKVALSLELAVGIMLVVLGADALAKANKYKIHFHRHRHGITEHIHFHSHISGKSHLHGHIQLKKSFAVGLVHGLAGSAALTLLVLMAAESVLSGLSYILMFGIGSISGMVLISNVILLPFRIFQKNIQAANKALSLCAGLFSVAVGFSILYKIFL